MGKYCDISKIQTHLIQLEGPAAAASAVGLRFSHIFVSTRIHPATQDEK
jgi:hypothetical protein